MTVFFGIALGAAATVALVFAAGALIPAEWTMERSITVAASADVLYPLVASFQSGWSKWNPWLEPSMQISYSGPESGPGATQSWTGGDTRGGRVAITAAEPGRLVCFSLEFGPFPIAGRIELQPAGSSTLVRWRDSGRIAGLPIYRFMRFGLDRFVGRPMERGLHGLKELAEADGKR